MLKTVNHIETSRGPQGKHLKFLIAKHPKRPYKHNIVVRVDTEAIADISILGQFCTYLEFRGKKYLNTFVVTNVKDSPNLLSHGATFRMGVLLSNYPEENIVKGENVPNFEVNTGTSDGTSNVFQILQDL